MYTHGFEYGFQLGLPESRATVHSAKQVARHLSSAALKCFQPHCPLACDSAAGSHRIYRIHRLLSPVPLSDVAAFSSSPIPNCTSGDRRGCMIEIPDCGTDVPLAPARLDAPSSGEREHVDSNTSSNDSNNTSGAQQTHSAHNSTGDGHQDGAPGVQTANSANSSNSSNSKSRQLTGKQITMIVWVAAGVLVAASGIFLWRMLNCRPRQRQLTPEDPETAADAAQPPVAATAAATAAATGAGGDAVSVAMAAQEVTAPKVCGVSLELFHLGSEN